MKVLLLAGSKCSGKTTTATAIYGYHLVQQAIIPNAKIDDNGRMSIVFDKVNNKGIYFDIDCKDPEFLDYKNKYTAAHINHVAFADELKRVSADLFGLDYNKLIGTNDEKNELTHIKWVDMAKLLPVHVKKNLKELGILDRNMTHREFMESFGTDICRTIYQDCHVQAAWKKIRNLNPDIGIITDCRFAEEFIYSRAQNDVEFLSIRFLRNPFKSDAKSEIGLESLDNSVFDLVVPEDMSMKDRNEMVIKFLVDKKFLSTTNVKAE